MEKVCVALTYLNDFTDSLEIIKGVYGFPVY